MAWTDKMVEDLKQMWKDGLTTGEIGKRLGVSKNSIVGKVHRLGLSGRPSPIKKKGASSPSPAKNTSSTSTTQSHQHSTKAEAKAEAIVSNVEKESSEKKFAQPEKKKNFWSRRKKS